jgi:hypothetical protein
MIDKCWERSFQMLHHNVVCLVSRIQFSKLCLFGLWRTRSTPRTKDTDQLLVVLKERQNELHTHVNNNDIWTQIEFMNRNKYRYHILRSLTRISEYTSLRAETLKTMEKFMHLACIRAIISDCIKRCRQKNVNCSIKLRKGNSDLCCFKSVINCVYLWII